MACAGCAAPEETWLAAPPLPPASGQTQLRRRWSAPGQRRPQRRQARLERGRHARVLLDGLRVAAAAVVLVGFRVLGGCEAAWAGLEACSGAGSHPSRRCLLLLLPLLPGALRRRAVRLPRLHAAPPHLQVRLRHHPARQGRLGRVLPLRKLASVGRQAAGAGPHQAQQARQQVRAGQAHGSARQCMAVHGSSGSAAVPSLGLQAQAPPAPTTLAQPSGAAPARRLPAVVHRSQVVVVRRSAGKCQEFDCVARRRRRLALVGAPGAQGGRGDPW